MKEKQKSLIEKIKIDSATFHCEEVEPTFVNFFFGKNGAGKSTIAKALQDGTGLTWATGQNPDDYVIAVYNQDFVNRNFATYGDLKGVFTLSETNIEIQKQIDEKTAERSTVTAEGKAEAEARDKKKEELAPLRAGFEECCWRETADLRDKYKDFFKGKQRKNLLADEVLAGRYAAVDHSLDAIQQLFEVAFDPNAQNYGLFKGSKAVSGRYDLAGMAVLPKAVTRSCDTPFANFMKALNATDWVKSGHAHYVSHADGKCPFCQQKLPASYEKDIAECFDEQYQNDLLALEAFQSAYSSKMQQLLSVYQGNLVIEFAKLDLEDYRDKLALLESAITINEQRIADKLATPAKIVALEDTDALIAKLDEMVAEFNKQIQANNDIVATKQDKQQECIRMVWELVMFRLAAEAESYLQSKKTVEDAAKAHDDKVRALQARYRVLSGEINDLSTQTINTKATVDSINAHLADSGFEGFHLREKEGVKGVYEVIREDGTIAVNLSEGERNFIAFLYFYHVVRGSQTEVDSGKDKVVVIDDPVSSMDSSALFIVSSLVREMIGVCSNNVVLEKQEYEGNYIKQLFVLTHNAFFHREITYNMVRHYRYVSFYKINKKNNVSTIELCVEEAKKVSDRDKNYNPVQNSYSALWTEYSTLTSTIPLMNVIRRILEYYFLQLCGYEGYDLTKKVLEEKKDYFITPIEGAAPDMTKFHLAKSMLAYMHSTDTFNDGLNFVDESMDCDQYRDVFKTIFEVLDQSQHYNRMMNETE